MTPSILSMPAEQYRAANGISKSDLDWISPPRTPAHFYAKINGKIDREETEAMRIGTLTHRVILEPDTMQDAFAVKPEGMNFATKEGKAWRAEQTKPIVAHSDLDSINKMRDAVWSHPVASKLLKGAKTEQCLFSSDENDVVRKARLDAIPTGGNAIVDLKTCASADPEEFGVMAHKYRYHCQAAWYLALAKMCGLERTQFVFICVEKTEPYLVACHTLEKQALEIGSMLIMGDYARYLECLKTDSWPGYPSIIGTSGLPSWIYKQFGME